MADEIKAAGQQGALPNSDGARTGAPAGAIQSEPPRSTPGDTKPGEQAPPPPFFQRHFHTFVGGGLGVLGGLVLWLTGTDWKLAIVVGLLVSVILAQLSR